MSEENSRSRSKIPWIISILVLLLALPIVGMIVINASTKEGVEFSPDDFTVRWFSYSRIEWLNLTLRGIRYDDRTTLIHQSLIDDAWIQPKTGPNQAWHLISDTVTRGNSPDFDARILDDYLRMPLWEDWNLDKKNAPRAKVLWPAVATLARNYAYWAIPDLLDLVINQKELTDQEFVAQIRSISAQALLENGQSQLDEGLVEEAEKSLTAGITFRKTQPLYQTRAEVYDQLNKPELAEADRESATQIIAE